MMRTDSAKSVTHVSDVNRHPCPGLNNCGGDVIGGAEVAGLMGVGWFGMEREAAGHGRIRIGYSGGGLRRREMGERRPRER